MVAESLPDWLGEDPFNIEKLHADLRPYVVDGWLRHPFVISMPPILVNHANAFYEQKVKEMARATKAKDWGKVIILYEKPYRIGILDEMYTNGVLTEVQTRHQLAWVWSNIEAPHQYGTMPLDLFRAVGFTHDVEPKDRFTDHHANRPSAVLPWKTSLIYRGQRKGDPAGISWTLDRERAEWFANRLRREGETGQLVTGTVRRADVLGYFTGRGEDEIVVDPEQVQDKAYEDVPTRVSKYVDLIKAFGNG